MGFFYKTYETYMRKIPHPPVSLKKYIAKSNRWHGHVDNLLHVRVCHIRLEWNFACMIIIVTNSVTDDDGFI